MSGARVPAAQLNAELQESDRSFRVNGLLAPSELSGHLIDADVAIVLLDIVRCTTTVTAALAAGASFIDINVKNIDEHSDITSPSPGTPIVLAGEFDGRPIKGGLFGNSALDVPADLRGVGVRFYSTNLGRAWTTAVRLAPENPILVGTVANLETLARRVRASGATRLIILCGGFYERVSLEDAVAGGRLIRLLGIPDCDLDDGALAMVALSDYLGDDADLIRTLAGNRIGRALDHYGRGFDIPAAVIGRGIAPTMWDAMTQTVGELGWIGSTPVLVNALAQAQGVKHERA